MESVFGDEAANDEGERFLKDYILKRVSSLTLPFVYRGSSGRFSKEGERFLHRVSPLPIPSKSDNLAYKAAVGRVCDTIFELCREGFLVIRCFLPASNVAGRVCSRGPHQKSL